MEELWELFPIVLEGHNPLWKEWAGEEIDYLHRLLHEFSPEIHHVGSTSVAGLIAKPIVDILVELPDSADREGTKVIMESNGYILMSATDSRMSFNKGYTPQGYADRVFHIHFRRMGDSEEILFRDYLIAHPETAKEYAGLKKSLLPHYRNDRDGYTAAKTEFIKRIVAEARRVRQLALQSHV